MGREVTRIPPVLIDASFYGSRFVSAGYRVGRLSHRAVPNPPTGIDVSPPISAVGLQLLKIHPKNVSIVPAELSISGFICPASDWRLQFDSIISIIRQANCDLISVHCGPCFADGHPSTGSSSKFKEQQNRW